LIATLKEIVLEKGPEVAKVVVLLKRKTSVLQLKTKFRGAGELKASTCIFWSSWMGIKKFDYDQFSVGFTNTLDFCIWQTSVDDAMS
jgi:hypothetical protein